MGRYVLRRILSTIVMLWVVATILFFFIHLLPGDPAMMILGGSEDFQPTPAQLERVRSQLGLDRPVLVQYVDYMVGMARGDLGVSFLTGRSVAEDLSLRFFRTLQLVLPAIVLASVAGVLMGVWAARTKSRAVDLLLSTIGLLGHSLPTFVVGNLLVLLFAIHWGLLPSSGYVEFSRDPGRSIAYMVLPVLALASGRMGTTMRMTRMAMADQASMDYSRTARAKGVSERKIAYRHQLKNAALPVVTVIGLQLGGMFAGAVIVEALFNWPGLNRMLISAVTNRDYPLIQGAVLLTSAIYMIVTLLTDITYSVLNPRIRYA